MKTVREAKKAANFLLYAALCLCLGKCINNDGNSSKTNAPARK